MSADRHLSLRISDEDLDLLDRLVAQRRARVRRDPALVELAEGVTRSSVLRDLVRHQSLRERTKDAA